ncbi:Hypp5050 [Branchiostoma lanceolatum]|uniref:Hypp5050 protein n=1 Tax=Branchiostoma lanceolatum TaxID=7740 RepID=A0A8K0AD42_BRALA|nr:Hypp5050 [Branchiostoma lanceolatum]
MGLHVVQTLQERVEHNYYRLKAPQDNELRKGSVRGACDVPIVDAKKPARSNCFSVRSVNSWNNLPADVVAAETVNTFKSKLDNHWRGLEYSPSPT